VVVLTASEDDGNLLAAIRGGAAGYLLKSEPPERIVGFLRGVTQGEVALSGQIARRLLEQVREGDRRVGAVPESIASALSARELRSLQPQVVVDMRAFRREEGRRVLDFKGVAERAVVASSADVYRAYGRLHRTEPGPPDPLPLTEDSPLREVVIKEDYDKVGVEREARADPNFPVTVLRLPAIHGPGDYLHRLHEYVRAMDDAAPTIEIDRELATWRWVRGYVEDVAHAIGLAATDDRGAGRTYNVADPVAFSEEEWVRRIAAAHGWEGELVYVTKEHAWDLRQ